jgi:1-acyl-sn-glycerol-3-phosphate acyltransferase
MHDRLLAAVRALALILWTGSLLPPALLVWHLRRQLPRRLARLWCRGCCAITGLAVKRIGPPARAGPTLFVANHVSYLDIITLGSVLDAAFIAKSEIAGWPLIGLVGRLGGTVFVQRRAVQSARQCSALAARLEAGGSLILFAEGTSTDGARVRPFKSALFGVLDRPDLAAKVAIQPVTIAYTRFRGCLAIDHALRPCYAWYGDMVLAPHLWSALGLPGAEVELRFHEPVSGQAFASRKALAGHAERQVADGLAALRQAA